MGRQCDGVTMVEGKGGSVHHHEPRCLSVSQMFPRSSAKHDMPKAMGRVIVGRLRAVERSRDHSMSPTRRHSQPALNSPSQMQRCKVISPTRQIKRHEKNKYVFLMELQCLGGLGDGSNDEQV